MRFETNFLSLFHFCSKTVHPIEIEREMIEKKKKKKAHILKAYSQARSVINHAIRIRIFFSLFYFFNNLRIDFFIGQI